MRARLAQDGEGRALNAGYREVASFNDEPKADFWFEKRLRRRAGPAAGWPSSAASRHSDCSSEFVIPPGPEIARALLL